MTIPPEVAKHLELGEKSNIVYFIDGESGYVMLGRADRMEVYLSRLGKPAVLGFSVNKGLAQKLLKKRIERGHQ